MTITIRVFEVLLYGNSNPKSDSHILNRRAERQQTPQESIN